MTFFCSSIINMEFLIFFFQICPLLGSKACPPMIMMVIFPKARCSILYSPMSVFEPDNLVDIEELHHPIQLTIDWCIIEQGLEARTTAYSSKRGDYETINRFLFEANICNRINDRFMSLDAKFRLNLM